jgi:hypothetical protein
MCNEEWKSSNVGDEQDEKEDKLNEDEAIHLLPNYCGDGASNHSGVNVSKDSEARANSEIRRHKLLLSANLSHKDPPTLISSTHSLGIGELENWTLLR